MEEKRLKVLLLNAIDMLEEEMGFDSEEEFNEVLIDELGFTKEELEELNK